MDPAERLPGGHEIPPEEGHDVGPAGGREVRDSGIVAEVELSFAQNRGKSGKAGTPVPNPVRREYCVFKLNRHFLFCFAGHQRAGYGAFSEPADDLQEIGERPALALAPASRMDDNSPLQGIGFQQPAAWKPGPFIDRKYAAL